MAQQQPYGGWGCASASSQASHTRLTTQQGLCGEWGLYGSCGLGCPALVPWIFSKHPQPLLLFSQALSQLHLFVPHMPAVPHTSVAGLPLLNCMAYALALPGVPHHGCIFRPLDPPSHHHPFLHRPCALTEEPRGMPLEIDQGDVIKV